MRRMTAIATLQRTADPYRDTDVIDARAPRFNQAMVGVVSLVAVVTGWWPLLALLAAQLAIGLYFGRRYCLPCLVYFELIQPRLGEGEIEDARPPRFANIIGFLVLSAASIAYLVGLPLVGAALGLIVAALALLAATTGLCVGCEIYRLAARLRGLRSGRLDRIDPADVPAFTGLAATSTVASTDAPGSAVEFTHPLCSDCHHLERSLREQGWQVATIDVKERPDLAKKYGVVLVPTAVSIDASGAVTARLA
jgi:glutaredoxin